MISQMIGEQIKSLRKKRNLTQQQLANRAGVHRVTIVQIENGNWISSISTLEKIAEALGADWSIKLRENIVAASKVSFCRCSGAGCERCKGYGWRG